MQSRSSDVLAALAHEYWEARLVNNPLHATALGDRRYDNRLPEITPQTRERIEREYEAFLHRANDIDEKNLSLPDQLTRNALIIDIRAELEYSSCKLEEWTIDPLDGPQVAFLNVESYQPIRTPVEGQAMARRWQEMGKFVDDHIANLSRGLASNKVAVRTGVERVIDQIRTLQKKPDMAWTLLRPLLQPHDDWAEPERLELRSALTTALSDFIRPAFFRYVTFLESEVLPRSRSEDRPGLIHVPGGSECYRRLIRVHTSLDLAPDALHNRGLREVARINGEMEVLGEKVFGTRDRKKKLDRLRTDPSLYFTTRDEVAEKAESALARAKSAISQWFGRLPKADCEVVRMGEHEEKHSTIAYYREPAADGSRPGRYYVNTSTPETRPRYEAEVLAYHEAIPGHHLQIAIAQQLENIPEFRRYSGVTAFVEGWALYTERLADEMGLYSSDLDRIGVLSYDAWRACRLVVDTGMHSEKWTRQQAIEFMFENTALARNNIVNEVDRYITWPGQALAYKTGQLEILKLRMEVERRLGKNFDIRKFHDAVLGDGAVALESLRQIVERYAGAALRRD